MEDFKPGEVARHLLKIREIFDTATHKLPRLQTVERELHTSCYSDWLLTCFQADKKNGILWVDWSNVKIEFYHQFEGFNGYCDLTAMRREARLYRGP
jgi:hypothetical protein